MVGTVRPGALTALTAALIVSACSRDTLNVTAARLAVGTALIDFGAIPEGSREVRRVDVENDGGQALQAEVQLAAGSSQDFELGLDVNAVIDVEPHEVISLEVTFEPNGRGSDEGLVIIDAGDAGEGEVQLRGGPIAPRLTVTPDPVDFAGSDRASAVEVVRLRNDGQARLGLASVELAPDRNPDFALLSAPATPVSIEPGRDEIVTLEYTRGTDDGEGLLLIGADDGPGDGAESDAVQIHEVRLLPNRLAACANDADDDGDGLADYPDDRGCADLEDDDETDPADCLAGDEEPCGNDEGECVPGVRTCDDSIGTWGACAGALGPFTEDCDGLDDDCDGVADDGITRACTVNGCAGTEACIEDAGGTWGACIAQNPQPELCDGIDDDCNGIADDGVSRTCTFNGCAGTQLCIEDGGGTWDTCAPTSPQPETCDGNDNDCNGTVDDGIARTCTINDCAGTQACLENGGGTWLACAATNPQPEVCDGADNDCDGSIDENVQRACDVNGCPATEICTPGGTGTWEACVPDAVVPETCDGDDDDCNGIADDGVSRMCTVNGCAGTQLCIEDGGGTWDTCVPTSFQPETCDGNDNDCNGLVDDGVTRTCTINLCAGTQSCLLGGGGTWRSCVPVNALPEVCDGADNDCDGIADDGVSRACTVNGCPGTESCIQDGAGTWGTCVAAAPQPEACDGIDNNCDGRIDEGVLAACTINGCSGTRLCIENAGGTWDACLPQNPQPEVCDGADNDCDGNVDQGGVCGACDPDGVYVLGPTLTYSCCFGLVSVNVNSFSLGANGAVVQSSPSNPITMSGTASTCPSGSVWASGTIPGGCAETYTIDVDFTGPDTFTGTYTASFTGPDCSCFGGLGAPCVSQTWPITGTR